VNYHINKDMSFKAAATLYNYIHHGQNTVPGGTPEVPGFQDNLSVKALASRPMASVDTLGHQRRFAFNQTGINDLLILDFPFEFNFNGRQAERPFLSAILRRTSMAPNAPPLRWLAL